MTTLHALWWGVWALWAVAAVLERVAHLDRLGRFRAVHARWRQTARALNARERREVARAVRRGEAVADPGLADAAVDMAEAITTKPPRTRLRRVADVLFLVWLAMPIVVSAVDRDWTRLAITLLPVLFLGTLIVLASGPDTAAQAAMVANRRVARPTLPPFESPAVNLGVGLPKSVARARRQNLESPSDT
jgi:hypothetical protein